MYSGVTVIISAILKQNSGVELVRKFTSRLEIRYITSRKNENWTTEWIDVSVISICKTIQYNTIQYITIQYNTVQYNAMQYNTTNQSINQSINVRTSGSFINLMYNFRNHQVSKWISSLESYNLGVTLKDLKECVKQVVIETRLGMRDKA